jgi:hypothetical protein
MQDERPLEQARRAHDDWTHLCTVPDSFTSLTPYAVKANLSGARLQVDVGWDHRPRFGVFHKQWAVRMPGDTDVTNGNRALLYSPAPMGPES